MSLRLNGNRYRDTTPQAMLHAARIILRSLPREVQTPRRGCIVHSQRSTVPISRRSVLRSAAAERQAQGEACYRGNADRFPRLIPHATVRRLERFPGLVLRVSQS